MVKQTMEQIEKTDGYKFSELTPEAKEVVIDNHRDINVEGYDWWDFLHDNFMEEIGGLGLVAGGFYWSIDRDRHFYFDRFRVEDMDLFIEKFELGKYKLLLIIYQSDIFWISLGGSTRHTSNYAEVEIDYADDEEDIDGIEDIRVNMESDINDKIEKLADKFLKEIEAHYDYITSSEGIIDTIECNDYLFNKDGSDY